ncbi:MAG: diacylglycerol kinase family protein [Chitinophagaceae bacterium]|nr:diacylglycerol kinase family protein [Chitinophagaceae bacterium]
MSSFKNNVKSANAGIRYFFQTERNGRIQAIVSSIILLVSWFFGINRFEWCLVIFCIALVMSLEMVNTALERVCAMLSTEYHPMVKIIKDVAAGAVWWASIFCIIIGAIIFLPYVMKFFNLQIT